VELVHDGIAPPASLAVARRQIYEHVAVGCVPLKVTFDGRRMNFDALDGADGGVLSERRC
jgi:hypothetical protein